MTDPLIQQRIAEQREALKAAQMRHLQERKEKQAIINAAKPIIDPNDIEAKAKLKTERFETRQAELAKREAAKIQRAQLRSAKKAERQQKEVDREQRLAESASQHQAEHAQHVISDIEKRIARMDLNLDHRTELIKRFESEIAKKTENLQNVKNTADNYMNQLVSRKTKTHKNPIPKLETDINSIKARILKLENQLTKKQNRLLELSKNPDAPETSDTSEISEKTQIKIDTRGRYIESLERGLDWRRNHLNELNERYTKENTKRNALMNELTKLVNRNSKHIQPVVKNTKNTKLTVNQ